MECNKDVVHNKLDVFLYIIQFNYHFKYVNSDQG